MLCYIIGLQLMSWLVCYMEVIQQRRWTLRKIRIVLIKIKKKMILMRIIPNFDPQNFIFSAHSPYLLEVLTSRALISGKKIDDFLLQYFNQHSDEFTPCVHNILSTNHSIFQAVAIKLFVQSVSIQSCLLNYTLCAWYQLLSVNCNF